MHDEGQIGPITKLVARLKNRLKMGQKSHSVSPALDQQCLFLSQKEKKAAKYRKEWEKENTWLEKCTITPIKRTALCAGALFP